MLKGRFPPIPAAASWSEAPHFLNTVAASVRFSNFAGIPMVSHTDAQTNPRNLAQKTEGYTMNTSFTKIQWTAAGAALLVASMLLGGLPSRADGEEGGGEVKPIHVEKLANVPGKTLTVVTVNYAPGGKSGAHHHAGSVFAYVLSGAIRSENSATGPVKVYKAGESFFEPPGSKHLISENASTTEPASLLAVFVADDGAQLTTFDN